MKRLIPILLFFGIFFSCTENKKTAQGLSPTEALQSFVLQDSFQIELVASEPLVSDPVAMELDESGNIYVVELHGYPLDESGTGVIRKLTDTNGDGKPDKSTVFADHLRLPNGITRWKNGFLVTDVPDVFYLEDSDGDGKADIRDTLLTGFALSNPQHDANSPVYGPDNWIYIAHEGEVSTKQYVKEFGDTGQLIRFPSLAQSPTLPRNANGRNVRFRPDLHLLEMMSGDCQYGQTFDPWGHQFLVMNYKHIYQEVIAARYLANNPNLLVAGSLQNLSDHGDAAEVFPITQHPEHQLLTDVGVFTSACGITWYQGGLFPERFNQYSFVAEPVHNLVHIDRLQDKGACFVASRVYEQKEFLASTDPWFRPVQFYTGPDGALYLIDYYRQIIEHPEWTSEEVAKSGALYNGTDKGRIYRISPKNTAPMNWCSQLDLGHYSTQRLVQNFANPNIWWRRNSQRILVDRNPDSLQMLIKVFLDTTRFAPGKINALWTLEGVNKTDIELLKKALQDPAGGVRENAIRMAEGQLIRYPDLVSDLLRLESDPDPKVRYQLLCTLGSVRTEPAAEARQHILVKDIEDRWIQLAALTASYKNEWNLLEKTRPLIEKESTEGRRNFFKSCATTIGLSGIETDQKKLIGLATTHIDNASSWWQSAILEGLDRGMAEKNQNAENFQAETGTLYQLFRAEIPAKTRTAALHLARLIGRNSAPANLVPTARVIAMDSTAALSLREDALYLLYPDKNPDNEKIYVSLINPLEPESIQQYAIDGYIHQFGETACKEVINKWKTLTPTVRENVMDQFMEKPAYSLLLLNAVQLGEIQSGSIGWPRMVGLMQNDDTLVREKARKLLAAPLEDRDEVYKKYERALTINGDAEKGLLVFKTNCAICHQVNGEDGKAFGPDLASIRNRDPSFILADIINPNRSIADGFETWTVEETDGKKFTGILSSETSESITIRDAAGNQKTIPRSSINKLEAGSVSSMPQGLESNITVEQMADLLAWIKNPHSTTLKN